MAAQKSHKSHKPPKFTRKDLKHDSFVDWTGTATAFLQEHFMKLGIGVVAIAVVLLGISFYNHGKARAHDTAAYMLFQGQSLLSRGAYAAAQERFIECTDRFGGTDFGKRAYLDLANTMIALGDPQSALNTVDEGEAKVPPKSRIYRSMQISRAAALCDLERYSDAEAVYRGLLSGKLNDVERVDTTYRLADCLRLDGKPADAVKVLEDLEASYERGDIQLVQRDLENRIFTMRALAAS